MLSAKRDVRAARRFFKRMMRAGHGRLRFPISVDKGAAYAAASGTSRVGRIAPRGCKLRRVKYLNSVIGRTLEGVEAINMMRKGEVKRLAGGTR